MIRQTETECTGVLHVVSLEENCSLRKLFRKQLNLVAVLQSVLQCSEASQMHQLLNAWSSYKACLGNAKLIKGLLKCLCQTFVEVPIFSIRLLEALWTGSWKKLNFDWVQQWWYLRSSLLFALLERPLVVQQHPATLHVLLELQLLSGSDFKLWSLLKMITDRCLALLRYGQRARSMFTVCSRVRCVICSSLRCIFVISVFTLALYF